MRRAHLLPLIAFLLACGTEHERDEMTERARGREEYEETRAGIRASAAEDMTIGRSVSELRFVRNLIGFQGPESVKYDPEQDVWFVTNMSGAGSVKDGNGYISKLSAAHPDSATVFASGGTNGVALDSPKGMAIHGDTLWVADISVLRAFDRRTGMPLANIDFAPLGAVQLNDIAIGPDGNIYITDTGIMMTPKGVLHVGPDRMFVVGANRQIAAMNGTADITFPNGISWDSAGRQWIVVTFDPFVGRIHALRADGGGGRVIRTGSGRLDGVEVLGDGSIVFTSWVDSTLHRLKNGKDEKLLREIPEAADIGIDTRRNQIAIPLSVLGRIQIWSLGSVGQPASR
jgi:sugar lactone lactonase YvrE